MNILKRLVFSQFASKVSKHFFFKPRPYSNRRNPNINILGIETSCDDTGCAIINLYGKVLSEACHSQNLIHLRNGGIIPEYSQICGGQAVEAAASKAANPHMFKLPLPLSEYKDCNFSFNGLKTAVLLPDIAQELHRTYIEPTVSKTLQEAKLTMEDISAIAVTLKPGLPLSLAVGMKYAKHLARRYNKPIIPIHHMQAHALVARMHHDISFPFLVLLISGGHCLLAVVQHVDHFQLLGESMDCAPGEVFDKVARKMKLRNVPEYSQICGGQAVEAAASKAANPHMFKLPLPLSEYKDCNFSFNGLKTAVLLHLHRKEVEHKIVAHELIPEVNDLCAAMLMAAARHLVHRTQRAMEFCRENKLIPEGRKQLVVSGGVACNNYIFSALQLLCNETCYDIYRPFPKLCTDNGVMIAWNGLEKWKKGLDITTDFSILDIEASSPIGKSLIDKVRAAKIPTKLIKIKTNI